MSAQHIDQARVNEAFEKLKTLRKGTTLGGIPWKELRDEGRERRGSELKLLTKDRELAQAATRLGVVVLPPPDKT